jgi:hypothetical protein
MPNCTWMFIRWSSTNFRFFVPVWNSKWQRRSILKHFSHRVQCYTKSCRSRHFEFHIGTKNVQFVEDHPIQRSSSLKLMNWLNPNCKWMIIGMSFTKFLFFMPIGSAKWFRRRGLKCEKFTDDGRQVMAIVHLDLWSRWTKKKML